jgi:hypothetical protein
MIFIIHSDDIAATFFVRFFTDLFLRFPFIGFFIFEQTRLGVKIPCAPVVLFFYFFSYGVLIDSLLATVASQKLQSPIAEFATGQLH